MLELALHLHAVRRAGSVVSVERRIVITIVTRAVADITRTPLRSERRQRQ